MKYWEPGKGRMKPVENKTIAYAVVAALVVIWLTKRQNGNQYSIPV